MELSDSDKIYGLACIWQAAAEYYPFWDQLPDLDWDQTFQAFLPRVINADNIASYYDVLDEFVACLQDGHSVCIRPKTAKTSYYSLPMKLSYMEGKYVVAAIDADSVEIPLGSEIIKINHLDPTQFLEEHYGKITAIQTANARESELAFSFANQSKTKDSVTLQYIAPNGKTADVVLNFGRYTCDKGFGIGVPENPVANYVTFEPYFWENGICYLSIPTLSDARIDQELTQFLAEFGKDAKSFILDLRGNHGGNSYHGLTVLSHFCDVRTLAPLSQKVQSKDIYQAAISSCLLTDAIAVKSIGKELLAKPEVLSYLEEGRKMFYGIHYSTDTNELPGLEKLPVQEPVWEQPVIILTDWFCSSAAEDMVAQVVEDDRFTVIGTNTHGTTGQLAVFDLPNGGKFYLTCVGTLTPQGTMITNHGINPDFWVEQTVHDALAGKDTVLERAMERLQE